MDVSLKYAVVERERRFLLRSIPGGVVSRSSITDGFAEHRPGVAGPRASVSVRAAFPEDLAAIEKVQHSAGRESHPEACLRAISDPQRLVVVAVVSGHVTGWAQTHRQLTHTDPAPVGQYLGGVTVDPDWRRQGIAVELTETRMRWLAQRSDEVFFVVNPQNRASIGPARSLGLRRGLAGATAHRCHVHWGSRVADACPVGRSPEEHHGFRYVLT